MVKVREVVSVLKRAFVCHSLMTEYSRTFVSLMLAGVDVSNIARAKRGPVFKCIISSSRTTPGAQTNKNPISSLSVGGIKGWDCAAA